MAAGLQSRDEGLTENSWYVASAPRTEHWPALSTDIDTDVCVIGGGLAGLSAALDLRARGYRVAVLEAREMGWGASGRNGGQALVGLACDIEVIERQLGFDDARRVWDTTLEALDLIHERRSQHQIDCDWQSGYLSVAVSARKTRELHAWCEQIALRYGFAQLRPFGADEVQDRIASPRFAGGAFDPVSGHLHPLKYTLGLASAAAQAGAALYEHTAAVRIERGTAPVVHTRAADGTAGVVRCRHVLLAGNVYSEELVPEISARIMPVGTYIVASAPVGAERARALIPSRAAVCDTNFVLDYFRFSHDDRMLFGGRVSYSTVTPMNLAESMRRRMCAVFPQLADVPIDHAWGGFVDITMNRAPDFGRIGDNLWYLQGFSGHGLALTGLAGRLAAEAIAGQSERFDVYARLRHHAFPGGRLLRTPALVLAMAWYRLRDLLG